MVLVYYYCFLIKCVSVNHSIESGVSSEETISIISASAYSAEMNSVQKTLQKPLVKPSFILPYRSVESFAQNEADKRKATLVATAENRGNTGEAGRRKATCSTFGQSRCSPCQSRYDS
jgi:hypothetical protein